MFFKQYHLGNLKKKLQVWQPKQHLWSRLKAPAVEGRRNTDFAKQEATQVSRNEETQLSFFSGNPQGAQGTLWINPAFFLSFTGSLNVLLLEFVNPEQNEFSARKK